MADEGSHEDLKESINGELRDYYQQLVKLYRPDLQDEVEAGILPFDPIFHDLSPHHFPEKDLILKPQEKEKDHRKIRVVDFLTTQLESESSELPKRILLLGRPESGKTALFALILHYWLHDKTKVKGLDNFDILVAIQCLSLDLQPSIIVDFKKDLLARLPKSTDKYGEDKILQFMKEMKVLILIDSLDYIPTATLSQDTLKPWEDKRIVIFSRLKFMEEAPNHPLKYQQSKDNMVLQLWGGVLDNPYSLSKFLSAANSDLFGGLSGKLFEDYCKRLCEVKKRSFDEFMNHMKELLKNLATEMRKPFNIYMAFQAWEKDTAINAKTVSEMYTKCFELWTQNYKTKVHLPTSDLRNLIVTGSNQLSTFVYHAFDKKQEHLLSEDCLAKECNYFDEIKPFIVHLLVPHYNASGKIQALTFRIKAHQTFFVAKYMVTQISHNLDEIKNLMILENFHQLCSVLPMTIGLMRKDSLSSEFKSHVIKLGKFISENEVIDYFNDPIINSTVQVLAESGLYNKVDDKYDKFVKDLLQNIKNSNWHILDGNLLPQALQALCECGHEANEKNKTPQKLNLSLSGLSTEMPGIPDILKAVRGCDIRIGLLMNSSFMGTDEKPLDEVIKVLHGRGHASLGKFTGYLKDVRILDSHPSTRRLYSISLRIKEYEEYENLYKISKNSHKLSCVVIRIPDVSSIKVKKLKELPPSITHLKVCIEGVTDETIGPAIAIWRAIRGNTQRKNQDYLRFWDVEERKLSPSGVIQLINVDLPADRIDIPLDQPLNDYDEKRIQEKLNEKKSKCTVKLMGSVKYPRRDLKYNKDEK
ncbi:uncharacterized protein LOC121878948 [Homarus americanus]|uniref:uncharacterized protein LOC121878948 n=1 Tax=Homarus americanus TaxID=6706 RepID=UPI001C43AF44|nr:uncharacterized protein LOC121878948 [Homarus americanus]XP_042241332.1 uncharacterized protein LOC121878948 [Homarus americanus]